MNDENGANESGFQILKSPINRSANPLKDSRVITLRYSGGSTKDFEAQNASVSLRSSRTEWLI